MRLIQEVSSMESSAFQNFGESQCFPHPLTQLHLIFFGQKNENVMSLGNPCTKWENV